VIWYKLFGEHPVSNFRGPSDVDPEISIATQFTINKTSILIIREKLVIDCLTELKPCNIGTQINML
jgi:hypothetical protein